MAEEPSLLYYLPIAGGRIIGFIPFPKVLVLCEMQSVSSKIWTRVTVPISCDDNHYTTGVELLVLDCNTWTYLCANKWVISNKNISVRLQYLPLFNCA